MEIIRGRLKYLLNREPYSTYISLLENNKLRLISEIKTYTEAPIEKFKLAKRFENLSAEDRRIIGVFFQAIKE